MKSFISILFLFFLVHTGSSQGIDFFEGEFEEALELAKQQDKLIFVDAYTTWCGPCKRMKKYIFPNKKAGDFYNKYFINMAIDMEKQKGMAFGAKYPVRGYPTFLFIDGDGNVVFKEMGGKPMELFIKMGENALKANDKTEEYTKIYESGNRDFDFMLKYVTALNRAEKASASIVYDYLNNGPKLSSEQKTRFLFESTCCADSKLYDMLVSKKNRKKATAIYGEEAYKQKIREACWSTVKKGMEYNVSDLYEEAKSKFKKQFKKDAPKFNLEVDLAVAKRNLDASSYLKAAKKYVKHLETSKEANEFAIEMRDVFLRSKEIASFSEELSKKQLDNENTVENHYYFGKMLMKNKKYEAALETINSAIELSNETKELGLMRELKQLQKMATNMLRK